jgi:hypothetical protein
MHEGSKRLRSLALAAVVLLTASATQALGEVNPACGVPAALGDGWTTDSPDSVGLDGARLCRIADRLKETEANIHGAVIVRHGRLVFEQYFPGYDRPWGQGDGQREFDATSKHDMRSVSKSAIFRMFGTPVEFVQEENRKAT